MTENHRVAAWLEEKGLGKKTVNFKLRDWLFSRQRYWGEPFPIIWKKDAAGNLQHEALPESALPVMPPELTDYKPTASGEPPLARAKDWVALPDGSIRETNTMPQWAGSCWYYLRYLDVKNSSSFVGQDVEGYWMSGRDGVSPSPTSTQSGTATRRPSPGVDLYVGGTEHAVLHLLYARFWHKVLFDLGFVSTREPFFKLVNQGLILGELEFTAFEEGLSNGTKQGISADSLDITTSGGAVMARRKGLKVEDTGDVFIGSRIPENEVEKHGDSYVLKIAPNIKVDARSFKMSKSRGNVVNPDDVLSEYGADAFRLYEMFMGPLEMVKPWNTKGVEGVYRFLGRVWRMFVDEKSEVEFEQSETTAEPQSRGELLGLIKLNPAIKEVPATPAQLKTLHACIKKVTEDLDGMRFNTAISALMVFTNETMTWEEKPAAILREFLILLQPFAPHVAEELWQKLSTLNSQSSTNLAYSPWPKFDPALLVESEIEIPVQVNGKLRTVIKVSATVTQSELQALALAHEEVKPFIEGKTIKKVIFVPKRLLNLVVG